MPDIRGKRGFVTIATGDHLYFEIAENLLLSYRRNSLNPYPFALITDRENEITAQFDEVILIPESRASYLDKLSLFDYLPFEETIFIDADSLAYGDLNAWWDIFSQAGDFSAFGWANRNLEKATRWFSVNNTGKWAPYITFVPDFNGGVYYMRNTETCKRVFEIAKDCTENWEQYHFPDFAKPADEPALALGMAVCACEPVNRTELLFAPNEKQLKADILTPVAELKKGDSTICVRLIHWSSFRTRKSLYKTEVSRLKKFGDRKQNSIYIYTILLRFLYRWYDFTACIWRVNRKLKKIMAK